MIIIRGEMIDLPPTTYIRELGGGGEIIFKIRQKILQITLTTCGKARLSRPKNWGNGSTGWGNGRVIFGIHLTNLSTEYAPSPTKTGTKYNWANQP